jgi:hypothetical protein
MKLLFHHALAGLLLASAQYSAARPQPLVCDMRLVYVFETTPTEYVFVIGDSGFKTVRALEKYLATLPAGTTVRWRQGCERFGGEPLSSERELETFRQFCKAHRLSLEIESSA